MKVSWQVAFFTWWSFAWRAMVYGAIVGAIAGFLVGFFGAMVGYAGQNAASWGGIAGFVCSLPASVFALKQSLEKNYDRFQPVPGDSTA